jgi:chorismate synthase
MPGNAFGHSFRVTTWGESHGLAIGCMIDGAPPGMALSEADIQPWLDRRRPGTSRHTTQRKEPDKARLLSGVFEGKTTGTPISFVVENQDTRSKDYDAIKDKFRPGHAEYAYWKKYGHYDYRGGGRSSARETAMRVAAGAVARRVLDHLLGIPVSIRGALVQMGPHAIERANWDWAEVENNPFWCPDPAAATHWENFLDGVRKAGSSTGAVIEVVASGVPAGLGEPVYDKLDADLAKGMMRALGRGQRRRDAHARRGGRVPVQQRRRHPRRDFHRPGPRRALRREADQLDPDPAPDCRPLRPRHRYRHQRPPRPLRRDSRGPRGRGQSCDCSIENNGLPHFS